MLNLSDFSFKLTKYPIKEARKVLKEIQRLDKISHETYCVNKRKEIVAYHLENTEFYKQFVGQCNTLIWEQIPVMTKQDLQKKIPYRLSKDFNLKNCFVNKTSGSTGNPFYFAKDKFSHALTWAVIENRFNWHQLYSKKQARFYGLPKSTLPRFKEKLKDFLSNRFRFNVFDLSNKALENWLTNFSKNKYVYLNGYTTVLVVFARFLLERGIKLKEYCPTLRACVITSEMCTRDDRIILEEGFGVQVINEYGASELDLIAFEDVNNNFILNTETLFVEILDDNNQSVSLGDDGRIVITSLYNKAHPFIRYDIGDIGRLKKLNDGTLVLDELIGRKEDLVYLPSGKTAPGLTFYYVTKSIIEKNHHIKEIKVIQKELDVFEIQYSAIKQLSDKNIDKIKQALYTYLESNLKLEFEWKMEIERSKSGKLKQFTSLLNKK